MSASVILNPSSATIIAGIPDSVTIESTEPASQIYYTTDGSTPSLMSAVYTGAVPYEGTGDPFVLSAIAYQEIDGYFVPGPELSFTWTQTTSAWSDRKKETNRMVYSYIGGPNYPVLYGADGTVVYTVDVPLDQIEFLYSTRDVQGRPQESDFHQSIATWEETPQLNDDLFLPSFSVVGSTTFNPNAKLIVADNRIPSDVLVANGNFMTLRNPATYWGGIDYRTADQSNLVSGSHISSFYNKTNKTYVAYYFDSIDGKWVKSISSLDVKEVEDKAPRRSPLVFQWTLWGSYYSY